MVGDVYGYPESLCCEGLRNLHGLPWTVAEVEVLGSSTQRFGWGFPWSDSGTTRTDPAAGVPSQFRIRTSKPTLRGTNSAEIGCRSSVRLNSAYNAI